MSEPITIRELIEARGAEFQLRTAAGGEAGLDRVIHLPDLNRPSLALAGFTDFFSWDRIQIIGVTELRYLDCLTRDVSAARIEKMFDFELPCVIVTTEADIPQALFDAANKSSIPLLTTTLNTSHFYSVITPYLDLHFAPTKRIHGDLVDVYGMGVLITGESGAGKSECALELVERGHRLIADDVVTVKRPNTQTLIGMCNDILQHNIEVRGLGIMDIETLFGIGAVKPRTQIDLVIVLEHWREDKVYERVGLDTKYRDILGTEVPEYILPVKPGRNLAILCEVAALNQRLTNSNRRPASVFEERLSEAMRLAAPKKDTTESKEVPGGLLPQDTYQRRRMRDFLSRPTQDGIHKQIGDEKPDAEQSAPYAQPRRETDETGM